MRARRQSLHTEGISILTLNESLTLLVLAGQFVIFWQQRRLMSRQLKVSIESEERAQRHDRLAVRPYLDIRSYFDGRRMLVEVSNEGLGIAIIKSAQLFIDGNPLSVNEVAPAAVVLNALAFDQSHLVGKASAFVVATDSALRPGGSIVVVDIGLDGTYGYSHMKRLRLVANYESLYGESFNLDWKV